MNPLSGVLRFLFDELGGKAIHTTGRNAYVIIVSRALRMFAHGTVILILGLFQSLLHAYFSSGTDSFCSTAPYLSELQIRDHYIGLFMTLTLLGDVFLGMYLTLIADKFGRRRVLFLGSCMMIATGLVFVFSETYFVLLLASVFGVVTVTGNDFGPFRSIEESMISELTSDETRADVLSVYIMVGGVGSAMGSEISGRLVQELKALEGWDLRKAYHGVFWVYAVMGLINAVMVFGLDGTCEVRKESDEYAQVATEEMEMERDQVKTAKKGRWWSASFAQISQSTLAVIYKLWILLAIDSIAEGMAPYALTTYYMDQNFEPDKSTLGHVTSIAYFLGAVSSIFSGPLVRRFGLVNTMVFTHAPSSAALSLFAIPRNFLSTVVLLFIRTGLERVDQAPRGAFIATIVRPGELTAVYGIAGMLRTLAAMPGPFITGYLADRGLFRLGFILAGSVRLAYDVALYLTFSGMEVT